MQACARTSTLSSTSSIAATPALSLQPQVTFPRPVTAARCNDFCSLRALVHHVDVEWSKSLAPIQSRRNVVRASRGESATTSAVEAPRTLPGIGPVVKDRVRHITTVEEFDEALISAKGKLVVVEYAETDSLNSRRIYPAMVELSHSCQDVVFLLVLGDETEATKELCSRAGVEQVPHFVFYKNSKMIHEEKGISAVTLEGDVLYYGDNDAPIHQIHNKEDLDSFLKEHAADHKLVVLDVGLKNCGPCVKVYPTVVKLSKKMADTTIFARMHGDENEDCMDLLRSMGVVEVPTFLFIRDGKPLGRYVGSGRGELIGEILRYNGVRVT